MISNFLLFYDFFTVTTEFENYFVSFCIEIIFYAGGGEGVYWQNIGQAMFPRILFSIDGRLQTGQCRSVPAVPAAAG